MQAVAKRNAVPLALREPRPSRPSIHYSVRPVLPCVRSASVRLLPPFDLPGEPR